MYCSKSTLSFLREPLVFYGGLDVNLSRSGRGGVSSEGHAGAGMRFSRKRQTPFFPRKEKRMIPCMWVLHIYPALMIRFALGKFWIKALALPFSLPFLLCSPLSKIIIFCKCQWNMVRVKLHFLENQVSALSDFYE